MGHSVPMDRTLVPVTLCLVLLAAGCSGSGGPSAEELAPSVGRVTGEACFRTVEGGAVLVGEGLYITNAHVIAGVGAGLRVRVPGAGEEEATVVGFDPERDLALLTVPVSTGTPFPFGSADTGDPGIIAAVTTDLEVELIEYEVLRRIVATGDDIYGEGDVERQAIEIAADVSSGVSGAGLINHDGELVGVVFAESKTRESTYAVDTTEIRAFIAETDLATEVAAGRCG